MLQAGEERVGKDLPAAVNCDVECEKHPDGVTHNEHEHHGDHDDADVHHVDLRRGRRLRALRLVFEHAPAVRGQEEHKEAVDNDENKHRDDGRQCDVGDVHVRFVRRGPHQGSPHYRTGVLQVGVWPVLEQLWKVEEEGNDEDGQDCSSGALDRAHQPGVEHEAQRHKTLYCHGNSDPARTRYKCVVGKISVKEIKIIRNIYVDTHTYIYTHVYQ